MFEIVSLEWCMELTKAGMPHLHGFIMSTKQYLQPSKLKKLGYPYRFSMTKLKKPEAWAHYILKEKNNFSHIAYCRSKNIPQFGNACLQEKQPQENIPQEKDGNPQIPV